MTTDISEMFIETLIIRYMTGVDGLVVAANSVAEPPAPFVGTGYFAGCAKDYDRTYALGVPQLFAFLKAAKPRSAKSPKSACPATPFAKNSSESPESESSSSEAGQAAFKSP